MTIQELREALGLPIEDVDVREFHLSDFEFAGSLVAGEIADDIGAAMAARTGYCPWWPPAIFGPTVSDAIIDGGFPAIQGKSDPVP